MTQTPIGVLVATLGGLAIGLERQWSGHATGPAARLGGLRTFALLGGLAGVSGWLWSSDAQLLAVVLLAAAAALVVAGYVAASRTDVDATTEVSALVVLSAGTLAGIGHITFASAIIAVSTLFLVEKSALHRLAARLDDVGLRAAARFAVMATVVLPLLPSGSFGPWGTIRPREVWVLVLFFSGLSFAAYAASRSVGPRHGYAVAGLLGGLISSTSVTFTFARTSRALPELGASLGMGVVAACTVLFVRVGVATLVLNPSLAAVLGPYLLAPLAVGLAAFAIGRRAAEHAPATPLPHNPLQLVAALQMAVMFQVVLVAIEFTRRTWGDTGIMLSGAILGLTDVDALTLSMARAAAGDLSSEIAARAILWGLLANTSLKLAMATFVGTRSFRNVVGASLFGIVLAIAVMLAPQLERAAIMRPVWP